jgi:hypothetical protein
MFVVGLAVALPASAADRRTDARVELTTEATLYGLAWGLYASHETDLNARPAAWLTAALAGGMFYGTWKLTERNTPSIAHTRFIESASGWLAADATLLALAASDLDANQMPLVPLVALGIGGGAAALASSHVGLSTGQLSLINSGGLWVPVAGLLLGVTFDLGDGKHLARDVLILDTLGLGAGIALCQRYAPTREQVLYMDGGLLLGGLAGTLFGLMTLIAHDNYRVVTFTALVGMGLGATITLAKYGLTRRGASVNSPATTTTVAAMTDRGAATLMMPLWGSSW